MRAVQHSHLLRSPRVGPQSLRALPNRVARYSFSSPNSNTLRLRRYKESIKKSFSRDCKKDFSLLLILCPAGFAERRFWAQREDVIPYRLPALFANAISSVPDLAQRHINFVQSLFKILGHC